MILPLGPEIFMPVKANGFVLGTKTHSDMAKTRKKPSKSRANKLAPSRKYVNRIVDWCFRTYGVSKHNRYFPEIQYRKGSYMNEDSSTMAFYDDQDGVIFINKEDHRSLRTLANSIIHEYTHYMQNMKHYDILSQYLSYRNHPLEIEANKIARRDTKKCLREITKE